MRRPVFDFVPHELKPLSDHNSLIQTERKRISSLLHDDLAQDLAFVNSQAAAIRILLSKGEMGRAMEQVELLEEVSQNLSGSIRSLIGKLNQSEIVIGDLEATLQELTERYSRRCQTPVYYEVSLSSEIQLSQQIRLEIYYIVQEAMVNICKHAAANAVWVQLVERQACVDVVVRDDGRGFQTRNISDLSGNHFGLSIMHARARRIGARLEIERPAECGAQLTLCIPKNLKGKYELLNRR